MKLHRENDMPKTIQSSVADYKNSDISVLIVDDEAQIRYLFNNLLKREGYNCLTAEDGASALKILENKEIDVVITDITMPGISGVELMELARPVTNADFIVMTGYVMDFSYENIIEKGASDFISKPMSNKELLLRLKRVIRERFLLVEREQINARLEAEIKQVEHYAQELNQALSEIQNTHDELRSAYIDTINRLVLASEYKDEDTGDHIIRISRISALIAEKIGLPHNEINNILYAAPMHDIGKIGIPDHILLKPGRLTAQEFDIIKTHTTIGASILVNSKADVLKTAHDIALTHHEKWNGKGYPSALQKEEIPIAGRIVGFVDVLDALTSNRPYKKAYPFELACEIIKKERENHFDPVIVDTFFSNIDEIAAIKETITTIEELTIKDIQWSERDLQEGLNMTVPSIFEK